MMYSAMKSKKGVQYRQEWIQVETEDEQDEKLHREPSEEIQFYNAVANGDVETVRANCMQNRFLDGEGVGILSRNPLVNLKYHFVITTAMVTRLCRENGMALEMAYRMSDYYIQKLDDAHSIEEVKKLHDDMVMDYVRKMQQLKTNDTNSRHINVCKNYVYAHLKERITIETLADELGVSPSYLSRLFKKETGISGSAYIREKKIEMAKNLLRYSDSSIIDIANSLAFSSQSHFIQQFRETVGMTPKKYRDMNYMVQWNMEKVEFQG